MTRPTHGDAECLIRGMRPITAESRCPVVLAAKMKDGKVLAHRYLPRARVLYPGLSDEEARVANAKFADEVPWIPGPPFIAAVKGRSP